MIPPRDSPQEPDFSWTSTAIRSLVTVMSDQPINDDLVRCAIAGDIAAFGSLYDRTVRLVRAVAADAGPDAADDVTHDTFPTRHSRNQRGLTR